MTKRIRVLHVEGESPLAQQAGTWIARNEDALDVTVVQTAIEGMEHLEGTTVDCVVAVCSGPENGLELLSHVREVDPALPFILVTENGDTAVAEAVRTDEATEYVAANPEVPQFDELADRIHEAVARSDMTDEGLETSLHGIDDELESLEQLHEATNRLYGAESVQECHEITIDTAVSILGFDWCMLGEADEELGRYRVRAASPGSPLEVGEVSIGIDEGLIGHAFATGESHVVDDVTEDDRAQPARETIRSVLSVPVDGWGVLQAVSTQPGEFDARDLRHAELLVDSMRTAVDLLESQRQLERQRNRLDDFTEVVSHDLRNPLAVAMGHLDLIEGTDGDTENIEGAMAALERMETLIEHLQSLAREGSDLGQRETLELETVASAAWETVDADAASLVIEDTKQLEADRTRLRQLFENLLRNAVEHGGVDVSIRIDTLEDGFLVEDDGEGIPPAERADIFQSGYSTSERDSGVGLTIAREIADAHGWEIDVTDGSSGGARFEITDIDSITTR